VERIPTLAFYPRLLLVVLNVWPGAQPGLEIFPPFAFSLCNLERAIPPLQYANDPADYPSEKSRPGK
jgi:hypothetical protein